MLQNLALSIFAAVMAVAAFEDLRRLTIPNMLPLLLCAAWLLYIAAAPSAAGILGAIGCALAVFLVGAVLFAGGWLGGGDVKLLSAATLWAGAPQTLGLLVLTGILGGVLALLLLSPIGGRIAPGARALPAAPDDPDSGPQQFPEAAAATPVPYGVAIAGAGLIVVLSSHIA